MDGVHDAERLKELQALPLDRKIQITQTRIIEWYQHFNGNVCVSFSGGKDSTVLLHIARKLYPDIPAVFSNTGLEYAAIQRFVKTYDNVDIIVPQMRFDEVISTYGYPLIGKEVAEAIHYARRIRSQSVNVERERTAAHHRTELCGMRKRTSEGKTCSANVPQAARTGGGQNQLIKTSSARNRRTVLSGRMCGTGIVRPSGNGRNSSDDTQGNGTEPG